MLRQLRPRPNLEKILEIRGRVMVLTLHLENELTAFTAGQSRDGVEIKKLYDAMYLPTAVTLADELDVFGIPDLAFLRRPLVSDGVCSQFIAVIQLLHEITAVLSPV